MSDDDEFDADDEAYEGEGCIDCAANRHDCCEWADEPELGWWYCCCGRGIDR